MPRLTSLSLFFVLASVGPICADNQGVNSQFNDWGSNPTSVVLMLSVPPKPPVDTEPFPVEPTFPPPSPTVAPSPSPVPDPCAHPCALSACEVCDDGTRICSLSHDSATGVTTASPGCDGEDCWKCIEEYRGCCLKFVKTCNLDDPQDPPIVHNADRCTPLFTPTPTPVPTRTPTPSPSASPTQVPTPSMTPSPSPSPTCPPGQELPPPFGVPMNCVLSMTENECGVIVILMDVSNSNDESCIVLCGRYIRSPHNPNCFVCDSNVGGTGVWCNGVINLRPSGFRTPQAPKSVSIERLSP